MVIQFGEIDMRCLLPALVTLLIILSPVTVLAQGQDLFHAEVLVGGDLYVQHLNSFHNCCMPIAHETSVEGFTIYITEIEPFINACWCLCYFDVDLTIENLPPGLYTIEYTWDADEGISTEDWQIEIWTIVMPDFNPPQTLDFLTWVSDCHEGQTIDVQEIHLDALKTRYR